MPPKVRYHPELGPFDPDLHHAPPPQLLAEDDVWAGPGPFDPCPPPISVPPPGIRSQIEAALGPSYHRKEFLLPEPQATSRRGRLLALAAGPLLALLVIAGFAWQKGRPPALPDPSPPEVVTQAETPPPDTVAETPPTSPPPMVAPPAKEVPPTIVAKAEPPPVATPPAAAPAAPTETKPSPPVAKATPPEMPAPAPKAAVTPPAKPTAPVPTAKPTAPPVATATAKPATAPAAVPTPPPATATRATPSAVPVSSGTCKADCSVTKDGSANVVTCSYGTWNAATLTPITGGNLKGCFSAKGLTPADVDGP